MLAKSPKMKVLTALTVSCLSLLCAFAVSKADEDKKETAAETQASDAPAKGADGALQGGVKQVELSLTRMRDVSMDISKLKQDAKALYGEATRQIVHIQSSPNIIGGAVVNIPIRFETGQYLPPRKKWVERYVADIGPELKLLKEGVDEMESGCREILVAESLKDDLKEIFSDWSKGVKLANEHYDDLAAYVGKGRLTNSELGSKSLELRNYLTGLERTVKAGFKLMRKSQKKTRNDKMVPIA
ncbi:MAG: hypothetical protein K2X27_23790 [Candidatus Obscuribacterales bacterium]|nr:hypothetical protein [Candidatus Obscuribacterales bacterium]